MRTHFAGSVIGGYPNIVKAGFTQPRSVATMGLGTNHNHDTFGFINSITNTVLDTKTHRIIAFQLACESFPSFWRDSDSISGNVF